MYFAERLTQAMKDKNSAVCVGLDPRLDRIPTFILENVLEEHGEGFTAAANAFLEFNKGIIDAVADLVPIVKPQVAFYEQLGFQGIWALEETCKYAKSKGLLVLIDGKRNDIGSTAEAYAKTYLSNEVFSADALTVNAYLGLDGVKPFLKECELHKNGIFVLVKTSNPSSGDIQDRITSGEEMSISELMAHFVESWGSDFVGPSGYHHVGAVVGATYPAEAKRLRAIMEHTIFLVPGFGAQGGTAEDVKPCFDKDGMGAIVNNSRGIIFAYEKNDATKGGEDFAEAARDAVIRMNDELNAVRGIA